MKPLSFQAAAQPRSHRGFCAPLLAVLGIAVWFMPRHAHAEDRIEAHAGGVSRAGMVSLALTNLTGCSYSLEPTGAVHSAAGDNGGFTVHTDAACGWTAVANAPWLHASRSGTGAGPVHYYFDVNTGPAERAGTITVGGQSFSLTQAGWPAGTWETDRSFGPLYNNGDGWFASPTLGWVWFEGEWAWSSKLQGWLSALDRSTQMMWSNQFRWLSIAGNYVGTAYTSTLGSITIIDAGWVTHERFGWLAAAGDGVWFWSVTYGWLGITADRGVWSVDQGKFL